MSLITLLTKKAPKLGGGSSGTEVIEFDASFEEELDASVEVTTYPIESGANPADSIIVLPKKYRIIGGVSDNPLSPSLTDFAGGALSNFTDGTVAGGVIAGAAGVSAGLLGGPDGDRSTAALTKLLNLMYNRKPFSLAADDINLTNMIITNIRRTRDPANEGGLIFEASLQEMATLDTVLSANRTNPVANADDASSSQIANDIDKGEVSSQTPDASATAAGDQI
jgi:hypothetical protein